MTKKTGDKPETAAAADNGAAAPTGPSQPAAAPQAAVVTTLKAGKLNAGRFRQAEFERTYWCVTPEAGVGISHLKEPSYWAHVASQLRPNDRIEVRSEDGAYFAELLVLACDRVSARVAVIHKVDLDRVDHGDLTMGEYEIKWGGPQGKWQVIRTADRALLRDGFTDQTTAVRFALDHKARIAA